MANRIRVILHPGFHKTGTTTVQQALRINRAALSPYLRIVLRPGMVAVCEAARAWSKNRDPLDMALFRYELAQLADGWKAGDPRPVLLASEDLCGHMPGRHGLTSYGAAPSLMQAAVETIAQARPGAAIALFFSTRAADSWLASCHAQHLAASRMTLSAHDYAERFRASADLDGIVDAVAVAQPHPVHRRALDASLSRRLGPLDPLLDAVGLPEVQRAGLKPQPAANTAPPAHVLDRLLDLNRSDLDDAALRAAKKSLLQGDA